MLTKVASNFWPTADSIPAALRTNIRDLARGGTLIVDYGYGDAAVGMIAGFGINDPDLTKDMYDEAIVEFKKMWAPGT